jgi:hypothetical protein
MHSPPRAAAAPFERAAILSEGSAKANEAFVRGAEKKRPPEKCGVRRNGKTCFGGGNNVAAVGRLNRPTGAEKPTLGR